jgi:hypothetical protein
MATGMLPPVSGIDLCRRGISGTSETNAALEFDYFALCVRHPVPFTRPKISVHTTYPHSGWRNIIRELFRHRSGAETGEFHSGAFTLD